MEQYNLPYPNLKNDHLTRFWCVDVSPETDHMAQCALDLWHMTRSLGYNSFDGWFRLSIGGHSFGRL